VNIKYKNANYNMLKSYKSCTSNSKEAIDVSCRSNNGNTK